MFWSYIRKLYQVIQYKMNSYVLHRLDRLEEIIMGLKEDFDTFVAAVNARTNEIAAALDEIRLDIAALKNPATTPEMLAAMNDIQAKLVALSAAATAIAADDTPVIPDDPL